VLETDYKSILRQKHHNSAKKALRKGAKKMANMTLEQFEEFAKNLPEDADHRKVAKALGVEIPVVVLPLTEQLAAVAVKKHVPKATKRNENPQETTYVTVPSLKLDATSGTRGFWVNSRVARQIAERILSVCDDNDL